MFQFLQPISLFAIAGIIIPVVIHLWNVRQGKILKVGSIALLQESDRQQARSIKLKDLMLLLLRCLLIILLAMLLAKPQYQKLLTIKGEKGWILTTGNDLQTAYKNYKPLFDSLTQGGYQFHYFEPGFRKAQLSDALKMTADTNKGNHTTYWCLLKALDEEVPAQLPIYLFTNNSLTNFSGSRPTVSMNLTLKSFLSNDTISNFISDAYLSSTGSSIVAMATSRPFGTTIGNNDLSLQDPPPGFKVENGVDISYLDSTGNISKTVLDTSAITCVIYTDKFANDANYLRAAINAIRDYGKYRINVSVVKSVAEIPVKLDWLFWLSEQDLPAKLPGNNIFVYEKGKEKAVHSWVRDEGKGFDADEPIETMKLVQSNSSQKFKTLWADGFGHQMLSISIVPPFGGQGGSVYHFYSRFNPTWSDLAWSPKFPEMIYKLLYSKEENFISPLDKRMIDGNQLQPSRGSNDNMQKKKFAQLIDLSNLFWLLAFGVFCIERFISLRRRKEVRNG